MCSESRDLRLQMYAYKPIDLFLLLSFEYLPRPLFTGHLKILSPYFPVHSNAPVTSLKLIFVIVSVFVKETIGGLVVNNRTLI